jgi:hypothetical protein
MAWLKTCGGLVLVLAVSSGCGDESADPEAVESTGGATSGGETGAQGEVESDTAADPTAGTTEGPAGGEATSGTPVQCEGADDGWGEGGDSSGGDGDDGSGGGTFGMDDDMPLATNVYDVQMGTVNPGELVSMSGLVATTPATVTETGAGWEMFVQEPAGGPYSGIRVRVPGYDPGELVEIGHEVAIVGRLRVQDGFYLVEIEGSGTALVPGDPMELPEPDVLSIEMLEPDDPVARQYEGVPVRVEEVVVIEAEPCEGEIAVGEALRVDDRFAPGALPELAEGVVIVAVEGVLVYALDAYEIAPTSAAAIE